MPNPQTVIKKAESQFDFVSQKPQTGVVIPDTSGSGTEGGG